MTGGSDTPSGQAELEKQVSELLESKNSTVELVSRLDFGYVEDRDQYADWHSSSPLQPMIRSLLFKELNDLSYSDLHRFLTHNRNRAEEFGFDEIPSRPTFGRTWNDRFDDELRDLIEQGAERIREFGRSQGQLIGLRSIKPEDKSESSRRTQDRYISEKSEEVTQELQRLVFPTFDFNRADNAHYETDAFLELQSHLGLSHSAAESGTNLFQQDTRRDEGAPDADTHLRNIKQLGRDQVAAMFEAAIDRMAREAKRHLEFNRPAEVAVDMTYVAYYGDRDELEMVSGAPPTKSYQWCFKFATLTVVGENIKLTLAVEPVEKGNRIIGEIIADLVEQAQELVHIHRVYADSEFCAAETFRELDELGVKYVIPSPKNNRVKNEINRMQNDIRVINGYTIYGPISDGRTSQPGSTNLVLLPSTKEPEKTVAFTTNIEVSDDTEIERLDAKGWVDRYSRRWGIENSYKTIKDFLAWTTSKEFVVRFFYFGFAVLLYNMWLLVDLIVQLSLDVEHRYKPRVTAKRFLNLARKFLREPG